MQDLLTVDTVSEYLAGRGLLSSGLPVQAQALGGGVSNVVLAACAGDQRVVVKQALPRLRVADEWLATRRRVITEAAALRWAGRLTPGMVPQVLDVDPHAFTITISHAPPGWRSWKEALLAGEVSPAIASRLGEVLAVWHTSTHADREELQRFDDVEAFEQLRVDPYYRTLMRRRPELAEAIGAFVIRMLATHCCLVHGDYSPKNVLFGDSGLWVVDFEVAHLGDPAFDLAFMLNHLLLKSLHLPGRRDDLRRAAQAFWDSYSAGVPVAFAGEPSYVCGHLACLLLARIDGKSPVEYLAPSAQQQARELGRALLARPPSTVAAVWDAVAGVA